jgi:outer membrane protein TolC
MGRGLPWLLLTGCLVTVVARASNEPLPDPLTIDDALTFARADLPQLERSRAAVDATAAELAAVEADSGVRVDLFGRLAAVDPSYVSSDRDINDSSAGISLRKRLHDFGYSTAREDAAARSLAGERWRLLDARQQRVLAIKRAFFDVVLADLEYARDNEAMAGAFLDYDRARERQELGTVSDVELFRLESLYQAALLKRNTSRSRQRGARAALALAMGRPDELVSDVIPPPRPAADVELPDYPEVLEAVLVGSPELKARRADLEAARAALEAARRRHGPVLSGELEASVYNRNTSSTHPLVAGLLLEVPLATGGARDAAIAEARAGVRASEAALREAEYRLRAEALDLWQRQQNLQTEIAGLEVRGLYRELYLDRSRALYEMEVRTDLGDAMTEISALRVDEASAEFDWMMTEARLAALSGRLLPEEVSDETP